MHPGWYPDPYSSGFLRWWDGSAWTAHTAPITPAVGGYGPHPRTDLADEQKAAVRASTAVLVSAAAGVAQLFGSAWFFGTFIRQSVDQLDHAGDPTPVPNVGGFALVELIGIGQLIAEIFLIIWLYRAASLARRAGIPSRRDPVWAILGFFVPIVNLWFPYQVAAGAFTAADPRRGAAGRWWTWYLLSAVSVGLVLGASAFSSGVAYVFAILGSGAFVLSAFYARKLIEAVDSAHVELVQRLTAQ